MNVTKKIVLAVLGTVAGAFIIGQLVMGMLLSGGRVELKVPHQHSGYTTVALVLLYIALSLIWTLRLPTLRREL